MIYIRHIIKALNIVKIWPFGVCWDKKNMTQAKETKQNRKFQKEKKNMKGNQEKDVNPNDML